jgi:multiple sugar transport system permease protein
MVAVVAIVVWTLGPIAVGVVTSLSTQTEVQAQPTEWIPHHFTAGAYGDLIQGTSAQQAGGTVTEAGDYLTAVGNSAITAVLATVITLTSTTLAAYSLSRLQGRFGQVVLVCLVGSMVLPLMTIVLVLYRLLADLRLLDTKPGLILVFVSTLSPLSLWLIYNQLQDLPREPEEAALIDGCTRLQCLWRVVLPQMRSGIVAVAAILGLYIWGEFLTPLIVTSTLRSETVTVLIPEYIGRYTANFPLVAAAGVLAIIPAAVLTVAMSRQIRGALSGAS